LVNGWKRDQLAALLLSSLEAKVLRVQSYFETYLGRRAESAGLYGFAYGLQRGMRAEVALATIIGSDEYFER
jgi:hypothetical protein